MDGKENLFLQALDLKITQLIIDINKRFEDEERSKMIMALPEWISLQVAAQVKGGAALDTYKTQYWLQPCCGLKAKRVGGRKVWRRDNVIEWLSVSDDKLWEYAEKHGAKIPDKYKAGDSGPPDK
jgi:hypothetical protein